jgi:hypothetical protein
MKFRFIRTSWEGNFLHLFGLRRPYLRLLRQMAGKKISQLGSSSSPVTQARIMLIEMERDEKGYPARCVRSRATRPDKEDMQWFEPTSRD